VPRNYLIHCTDCGSPRTASARNTRYCHVCRFLRDATFWQTSRTKRTCEDCGDEYFPFHGEHKLCAECSHTPKERRGRCLLCSTEGAHLIREVRVCYSCAMAARGRKRFLRFLEEEQERRLQQFGGNRGIDPRPLRRRDDDV